ncbi:winged helix-turn-helix domain-containing protein [Streptomyces sp. NPDC058394]|uniref:winged helix-turn-helix domain-containing protein n=1 Tax=Streptomyces sp. NPDC058394 TaxID=3346477 RepID=UPI003649ADBF
MRPTTQAHRSAHPLYLGWSWQAPARRALERDDQAVELWKKEVWPRVKASRRPTGAGSSSRTMPGSP